MNVRSAVLPYLVSILFGGCVRVPPGGGTSRCDPTSVASFCGSLSTEGLSMRVTHPELYEGRDDFARGNALAEIFERKLIRRGMTSEQMARILGPPDSSDGITLGESFTIRGERVAGDVAVSSDDAPDLADGPRIRGRGRR